MDAPFQNFRPKLAPSCPSMPTSSECPFSKPKSWIVGFHHWYAKAMHRPPSSLILVLKFPQFVWVVKIVHELTSSCASTLPKPFRPPTPPPLLTSEFFF